MPLLGTFPERLVRDFGEEGIRQHYRQDRRPLLTTVEELQGGEPSLPQALEVAEAAWKRNHEAAARLQQANAEQSDMLVLTPVGIGCPADRHPTKAERPEAKRRELLSVCAGDLNPPW